MASVSWNSSIGTFTVVKPGKMNWAKDINELWQEKQGKERQVKLNLLIVELKKCDCISYTSGRNASWMILKNGKIVYDEAVQKLFNQYSYETISVLVDVNIVHILGGEGIYLFPGGWVNGALTSIIKWILAILAGTGIVTIGGRTTLDDAYIDKLRIPTGLNQIKGGINKIDDDLSDLTNDINIWLSQNKRTRSSHVKIRSAEGKNVNTGINDLQRARPADILLQNDGRWLVTGGNRRVHVIDPSGEIVTTMINVSKSNLQKRINSNRWSRWTLEEKQQFENNFKDYLNWD